MFVRLYVCVYIFAGVCLCVYTYVHIVFELL
jgi:hypothetical protein